MSIVMKIGRFLPNKTGRDAHAELADSANALPKWGKYVLQEQPLSGETGET